MIKSFLKWAGSKRLMLPTLLPLIPADCKRAVEPFAGSAVFSLNVPEKIPKLVCDSNRDLIELFKHIKRGGLGFTDSVKALFDRVQADSQTYMDMRTRFNTREFGDEERARYFVYFNRYGFNGLCRYNSKGGFNVPYGYPTKKLEAPTEALQAFVLHSANMRFCSWDFRKTLEQVRPGDFVYCDPPYVPLSATSSFTQFDTAGFTQKDQEDLAESCERAAATSARILLSNHDTPWTRKLYRKHGAKLSALSMPRTISCKATTRQPAKEIIAQWN